MRSYLGSLFAGMMLLSSSPLCSENVKSLPGKISFRVGNVLPQIPLNLKPVEGEGQELQYQQNNFTKAGFGVDYSWLGFYLSTSNLTRDKDENVYGKTDFSDFQLHSYIDHWGFDFYWQRFDGYYTDSAAVGSTPLVRSDLSSRYRGVNLFYIFNPELMSLEATGTGTAMQLKSGGSAMLYLTYGEHQITSDAVVAPAGLEEDFGRLGNIQQGTFRTLSSGGGYGYNWVLGVPWYFHLSLQLGLGPQHQMFSTRDYGDYDEWILALKGTTRVALGFSGEDYFGALSGVADSSFVRIDTQQMDFSSIQIFLYIGFRL